MNTNTNLEDRNKDKSNKEGENVEKSIGGEDVAKDIYNQPKFNCVQCNAIFYSNKEYYNHICAGKTTVGYLCEICEEILKTVLEFKKHVKDHMNL
ncbi:hypothetical protein TNCT_454201 [Trichonephila clavata]|uniref:C2H2-type domain-containing protein n=1 Tax=Trichonephila clavata TaxID=2740835 RepID=A0A8X6G1U0_TRICU|nr:hypothetical protein TNCT_454201 [Trichonephila clavata]